MLMVTRSQIPCSVLDILVLVVGMLAKEIQVVHLFVTLMAKLSLLEWSVGELDALSLNFLEYMPELLQL